MAAIREVLASVGVVSHSPMVGPNGSATFPSTAIAIVRSACFGQGEDVALTFPTAAGIGTLCSGIARAAGARPENSGDLGRCPRAACHAGRWPGRVPRTPCFSVSAKSFRQSSRSRPDVDHCHSVAPSSDRQCPMQLSHEGVGNLRTHSLVRRPLFGPAGRSRATSTTP